MPEKLQARIAETMKPEALPRRTAMSWVAAYEEALRSSAALFPLLDDHGNWAFDFLFLRGLPKRLCRLLFSPVAKFEPGPSQRGYDLDVGSAT